jgi:putative adenylate-forming enzyme
MLAWALPDFLSRRHRVAVVLPINTRLYDTANESGRLALQFFDLSKGIEAQFAPLSTFRPTVIVAPPKFLTALAQADLDLRPTRLFSSAEVLDTRDRQVIEQRFSLTLGEIYMATEGLFGVSCPHGTLHLIEDHVAFEFEPVDGSQTLVTPIVTDFSRTTQIMARYRMNDILELHDQPCPCGLPHTAVKQVHGRCDDVFRFPDRAGKPVSITPDVIRNAIVTADPGIADFRVIQTGPNSVQLELQTCTAEALRRAAQSLELLFEGCGIHPGIDVKSSELLSPTDRKLRRVMVQPGVQNA